MKTSVIRRRPAFLPSVLVAMAVAAGGCTSVVDSLLSPPETVASVDVAQYMGKWYEIAKYPVPFEVGCYGVTAEYTLNDDGTVRVFNTCRAADGSVANTIEGSARVTDPSTNAKLNVSFFGPFGAPYWIIDLDGNYQWAVVSDPTRLTLWILSRTPTMDPQVYAGILERLTAQGYDVSKLELMQQFP